MKLSESRSRRESTTENFVNIIDDLDELKEELSVFGLSEKLEEIIQRLEVGVENVNRESGGNFWWNKQKEDTKKTRGKNG